jgi:hypothetical protein
VIRRTTLALRVFIPVLACLVVSAIHAQNNECDEVGEYPDVIVGSLHEAIAYGSNGIHSAYSVGTVSCNIGTCWLDWIASDNRHPVIGGNMFRLKDGRFEHIGQSWLKHGFVALDEELCSGGGCIPTNGDHLGVNCSDPYSAFLNGMQNNLGPKFEVNAYKGLYPFPPTNHSQTGNNVFKRLQVLTADVDPAQNPNARYFVEGQYVTLDDAGALNHDNNASWRQVNVTPSSISFSGSTQRTQPAIFAWRVFDPTVEIDPVRVPNEGLLYLGSKVTDLGGGQWRYEYALHNLNSHRSIRSFSIPVVPGAVITNVGFHDVHYHSGEPWSNTDWTSAVASDSVTWSGPTFSQNPQGNALRWGTLYNFRFDANVGPAPGNVTLLPFFPGSPTSFTAPTRAPLCDGDFDGDGACNLVDVDDDADGVDDVGDDDPLDPNVCRDLDEDACDDCTSGTADPANDGTDTDTDGICNLGDCAPVVPGEDPPAPVGNTLLVAIDGGGVQLGWSAGAGSESSSIYAGTIGSEWTYNETCVAPGVAGESWTDTSAIPPDTATYYLVGARNGCGESAIGLDSEEVEHYPTTTCDP